MFHSTLTVPLLVYQVMLISVTPKLVTTLWVAEEFSLKVLNLFLNLSLQVKCGKVKHGKMLFPTVKRTTPNCISSVSFPMVTCTPISIT